MKFKINTYNSTDQSHGSDQSHNIIKVTLICCVCLNILDKDHAGSIAVKVKRLSSGLLVLCQSKQLMFASTINFTRFSKKPVDVCINNHFAHFLKKLVIKLRKIVI